MSGPIRPNEVTKKKGLDIPEAVFDCFNAMIVRNWDGRAATFRQDEVAAMISKNMETPERVLYDNHWLDVEETYREAGWKVKYDKPAYCETYPATFTFSKRS